MIPKQLIEKVIDKALSNGADFAEIYLEDTYRSNIRFLDGKTKQIVSGKDFGAGICVFYGQDLRVPYLPPRSKRGCTYTFSRCC